jgi:hypothetical protein
MFFLFLGSLSVNRSPVCVFCEKEA